MSLISLITLQGQNQSVNNNAVSAANAKIASAVSNNIDNLNRINNLSTYDLPDDVRFNSSFRENNFYMSPKEILDKTSRLKDAEQHGKIFTLDTEMFGTVPEKLDLTGIEEKAAMEIAKANNKARIMTELSIVHNGKEVFGMSNTAKREDMLSYVKLIMNTKGTNSQGFNIDRGAGLANAFKFKNLKGPQTYEENADMLDENLILRGIRETAENSEYKISEPEKFKEGAQKLLDTLLDIANDEHAVLQTTNGQNYDMDVIFDHIKRAGVDITDEQKQLILASHVDIQRLVVNTKAKNSIFQGVRNRYDYLIEQAKHAKLNGDMNKYAEYIEEANGLLYNATNTTIYEAAQGKSGKTIKREDGGTHNARYDSVTTEIGSKAFYPEIYETADEIQQAINNSEVRNGYFLANSNIMLDKNKDIYFSNSFDDITNTYNQVAAQKGHLYKARMYSLPEDFSYEGLSAEDATKVKKAIQDKNMYVFELEDQYNYISGSMIPNSDTSSTERGVRKSYIITENQDLIQDYLNDGKLSFKKEEEGLIERAYEATKENVTNRIVKEREGWTRPDRKGYASFTNTLDAYEQWNNYKVNNNYNGTFEDFLNTASMEDINEYMPALTNRSGTLITERASKFKEMISDLDENYKYYSILRNKIDSSIGNVASIAKEYGVENSQAKDISNTIKTKVLNEAKNNIDNYMVNNAIQNSSQQDLINLVYANNSTPYIKAVIDDEITELMSNNKIEYEDAVNKALKQSFKKNFGVNFNKNLQIVKDSVLGYKIAKPTISNINNLDLLVNNKPFIVNTATRKNIEQSLGIMLNMQRNTLEGKNKPRLKYIQNNVLNNIFDDLNDRGLILSDDEIKFNEMRDIAAPQAKIQLLTDSIWNTKNNAEAIALKYSDLKDGTSALVNLDINNIKNRRDYSIVSDYITNIHLKDSKELIDGVERVMGVSKNEIINNLSDDLISSIVKQTVQNEKDIVYNSNGKINIQKTKEALMNKLGYTENHANILIDKVLNNPLNKSFERYNINGEKEKIGISNIIKIIDDKGYLFTVTNDNIQRLETDLLQGMNNAGIDLDSISKYATVFNLNKIENRGGINVIKQNSTSFKGLTKDVVRDNKGIYQIQDTYDQLLLKLGGRYRYALQQMSFGNYDRANRALSSVNRGIMEEKSLSAAITVPNYDGKGFIKEQRLTMSDYMLNDKFNIEGMMSVIPEILQNNKYNELRENLRSFDGTDIVKEINNNISKKIPYESYDSDLKMRIAMNSKDIADAILNEKEIEDQSLLKMLNVMKNKGSAMFLTKESGEAAKGFIDLIPASDMVAGSHASKASRPLINQVLNAPPVSKKDFEYYYKNITGKDFFNADGSNALGIIFGRSYVTKDFSEKEAISFKEGIHHAMSVKTKFMTSGDYYKKINEINNLTSPNEKIKELLSKYKDKSLEDVKEMASRLTSVSSLYEDSSLISPLLARLLGERGVTTEKLDKNINILDSKYKIGGTFKGKEIIGHDLEKNTLLLQNFKKYHDSKVIIGYSEKSEAHTLANLAKEEIPFAQDVFEMMFDGAQYVANPNISKHESFNSIIQFYTNAITNNISNEDDLKTINSIFAKHMPWQEEIIKKVNGRYSLIEGDKETDGNIVGSFYNAINEIKKSNIGGISDEISKIEKLNMGYMDIALAQDNTIEKRATEIAGDVLGGVKINYRSQQIFGMFIGEGGAEELAKYRRSKLGKTENLLSNVINSQIEEMMHNDRFVSAMEQSANINTALISYYSDLIGGAGKAHTKINDNLAIYKENLKKARIIPKSLDDAVGAGGLMSADIVPDVFNRVYKDINGNKNIANVYKIDISHLQLNNPIYEEIMKLDDNGKISDAVKNLIKIKNPTQEDLENFIKVNNIKEKIDTLYIPAMDAASLKGENGIQYNLLNIQKSYADLLNDLNDLREHNFENRSYDDIKKSANEKIAKVFEDLMSELTDKDGFFKKNTQIRIKESARLKLANISAPVSIDASEIAKKSINEKLKTFRSVAFVNEATLFGDDEKVIAKSYRQIARDLLKNNVDDSQEFISFFNNYYKENAKTISDVKNIFGNISKEDIDYESFGRKYLQEVGIGGIVIRDPAMLTSSEQASRIFVNNDVTHGSVWTDFVTAKYVNGDGDGDEIGLLFSGIRKKNNGTYTIKDINSKDMRDIAEAASSVQNLYYKRYKEILKDTIDKENKNKSSWTLSGYLKDYNENYKEVNGVVDYIYDKELENLSARYLKGAIGQVSNPNYFVKAGKTIYFQNKPATTQNLRMARNIGYLTDITEQSLIDVKSVTNKEQAAKLNSIARKYRDNIDRIMDLENPANRLSGLEELIRTISPILNKSKDSIKFDNKDFQAALDNGKELDNSLVHELAKQILNGEYKRGNDNYTSIEEIFGDLMKLSGDKKINDLMWSEMVRQTNLSQTSAGKLSLLSRMERASVMFTQNDNDKILRPQLFESIYSKKFNQATPIIDNILLSQGDFLKSVNIENPDIFKVTDIARRNGKAVLSMQGITGNNISITGDNFEDVVSKMSSYSYLDNTSDKLTNFVEEMQDIYSKGLSTSFEVNNEVFKDIPQEDKSLKSSILRNVQKEYDQKRSEDFLFKTKALQKEGYITNDEAVNLQKQMNEYIKSKGSQEKYEEAFYENVSNLEKFKKMGVSNAHQAKEFIESEKIFSKHDISSLRIDEQVDKLAQYKNFNLSDARTVLETKIDNILKEKNIQADDIKISLLNEIIEQLDMKNKKSAYETSQIYNKNAENVDFLLKALNIGKDTANSSDIEALKKVKIGYGSYAGLSVAELNNEMINEILSKDYTSNIDYKLNKKLVNTTNQILNNVKSMNTDGIINKDSINIVEEKLTKGTNFIEEIQAQMNEAIKQKGLKAEKSGENFSRKATKALSETFSNMTKGQKIAAAVAATAATAIGAIALYSSGNRKLSPSDDDKYRPKDTQSSLIKSRSNGNNYKNIPTSNSHYYKNQNVGVGMNIAAKSPKGADGTQIQELVQNAMGGNDINMNTTYSDDTSQPTNDEVDNMINDSI